MQLCQIHEYDGVLELRHEEDATFMAKLMYCASEDMMAHQPGTVGT